MSEQGPVRQHEELTSDISRGLSAWINRQVNRAVALGLLLALSLAVSLAGAALYVSASQDETELGLYHRYKVATWAVDLLKWRSLGLTITINGEQYKVSAGALADDENVAERVEPVGQAYVTAFILAIALSLFFFIASYYALSKKGKILRKGKLLQGAELVSAKELKKAVEKVGASDIEIGPVPIVKRTEVQHFMITGAPGVGKSVLLSQILDKVVERGETAIIYDKAGEFVSRYYDPSRGDVILNPLDLRCPAWTPWEEVFHPADALRLAKSLIPDSPGENAFFNDSAQSLMAAGLVKLERRGQRDIHELLRLITAGTPEELKSLVGVSPIATALRPGNEKTLANILGTVGTYTEVLKWLPSRGETFSIRRFIESIDSTPGRKPWLFLTSREDYHRALEPLLRCWIEAVSASILSLVPNHDRRIWLSLDELPSLGKLTAVPALMAQGRKYGAATLIGFQSKAQLREIYGREGGQALSDLASTRIVFRANDPASAEEMALEVGEEEKEDMKESHSNDGTGDGSRTITAERSTPRKLVLASAIRRLPNLNAYIVLPGELPVARIVLEPKTRKTVALHFEAAPVEWSVFEELERRAAAAAAQLAAEADAIEVEAQPIRPAIEAPAPTPAADPVPAAPWAIDLAESLQADPDEDPFADVRPPKNDPLSGGVL